MAQKSCAGTDRVLRVGSHGFTITHSKNMKARSVLSPCSIISSSFVFGLVPIREAQAVNLVTNGTFTGATVSGGSAAGYTNGAVTTSAYLGDDNVTLPGWTFSINSQIPSNGQKGFNFLVAFGSQIYTNQAAQNNCTAPYSINPSEPYNCWGVAGLVGSQQILDPVTNSASGFFISADAFFNRGAINTTVSGLTVGNTYTVSFYQATGQQKYVSSPTNFTDWFNVSFGGVTKRAATMSYTVGSEITPWTLQSLDFTATSATQTLSFLAESPNDVPPFALLSNVSVTSTSVPEPETYLGTIILAGFLGKVVKSRLAAKKKADRVTEETHQ